MEIPCFSFGLGMWAICASNSGSPDSLRRCVHGCSLCCMSDRLTSIPRLRVRAWDISDLPFAVSWWNRGSCIDDPHPLTFSLLAKKLLRSRFCCGLLDHSRWTLLDKPFMAGWCMQFFASLCLIFICISSVYHADYHLFGNLRYFTLCHYFSFSLVNYLIIFTFFNNLLLSLRRYFYFPALWIGSGREVLPKRAQAMDLGHSRFSW